jgi:hypothetical protein
MLFISLSISLFISNFTLQTVYSADALHGDILPLILHILVMFIVQYLVFYLFLTSVITHEEILYFFFHF